jgi:hypothetical protein
MQGDPNPFENTHRPIAPMATSFARWARLKSLCFFMILLSLATGLFGPVAMMVSSFNKASTAPTASPSDLATNISYAFSIFGFSSVCCVVAFIGYLFSSRQQSKIRRQIAPN